MYNTNLIDKIEKLFNQIDNQKSFETLINYIQNNQLSFIEIERAKSKLQSVIEQLEEQKKFLFRKIMDKNHQIKSYKKYIYKTLS